MWPLVVSSTLMSLKPCCSNRKEKEVGEDTEEQRLTEGRRVFQQLRTLNTAPPRQLSSVVRNHVSDPPQ